MKTVWHLASFQNVNELWMCPYRYFLDKCISWWMQLLMDSSVLSQGKTKRFWYENSMNDPIILRRIPLCVYKYSKKKLLYLKSNVFFFFIIAIVYSTLPVYPCRSKTSIFFHFAFSAKIFLFCLMALISGAEEFFLSLNVCWALFLSPVDGKNTVGSIPFSN